MSITCSSSLPTAVVADTSSPAPPVPAPQQSADHLRRRLLGVFFDLGLDDLLGDWMTVTHEGILRFRDLTLRDADQLARRLEDVADGFCGGTGVGHVVGQQSLFEGGDRR